MVTLWECSPQPDQPLVPLKMLFKGSSPSSICALGPSGMNRAADGSVSAVLHSPGARAGTGLSPSPHRWIHLTPRCSKDGMCLGPALASDWEQPAARLGQRDTSLAGTPVLAFCLAHEALLGNKAHLPPGDRQVLHKRSHSGIRAKCLNLWVLPLPCSYPPGAPLEFLPGRAGWGQAQHGMQARSRCKTLCCVNGSWHELLLVMSYPSAASEPSLLSWHGFVLLPSSVPAVCRSLQGIGQ